MININIVSHVGAFQSRLQRCCVGGLDVRRFVVVKPLNNFLSYHYMVIYCKFK